MTLKVLVLIVLCVIFEKTKLELAVEQRKI